MLLNIYKKAVFWQRDLVLKRCSWWFFNISISKIKSFSLIIQQERSCDLKKIFNMNMSFKRISGVNFISGNFPLFFSNWIVEKCWREFLSHFVSKKKFNSLPRLCIIKAKRKRLKIFSALRVFPLGLNFKGFAWSGIRNLNMMVRKKIH